MFANLSQPVVFVLAEVSIKALVLYGTAILILRMSRGVSVHAQHRAWTVVLLMWMFMPVVVLAGWSWSLPVAGWNSGLALADVSLPETSPAMIDLVDEPQSHREAARVDVPLETNSTVSQYRTIDLSDVSPAASGGNLSKASIEESAANPEIAAASIEALLPALYQTMFVAWGAGVIVMLARLAYAMRRTREICQRARALKEMTLPQGVDVRESDDVSSPIVVGWWRPCILLPAAWREWTESKRQAVLAHEQSHLRRGDAVVFLLSELLTVAYWFHPLSWSVKRRLSQLAELACDEAAALETGDRFLYAQHLIEIATVIPSPARYPTGITMAPSSEISHRVRSLLNVSRPLASRASLTSLAVILVLGVPSALLIAAAEPVVVTDSNDSASTNESAPGKNAPVEESSDQVAEIAADRQALDSKEPPSTASAEVEQRRFNPRDTTVPLADRMSTDPQKRILELVYILRNYCVFSRDEEMFQAVRELTRIGKPALPELIAELDRTDRDQTIRALGIALRALNDHRAVHALIRAIPKTLRSPGSDCGVHVVDPKLRQFMLNLERHPPSKDEANPSISVGRPVNEILGTLEKMTGFRPPEGDHDPLRHVFLSKDAGKQPSERQQFKERKDSWIKWWSENGSRFLTADQFQEFQQPTPLEEIPPAGFDKVDRAGRARFDALFPTGPGVRLGPVHEVELFDANAFADAPSSIDFDRGRILRFLEGAKDPARGFFSWQIENGIDYATGASSSDTQLWNIDPIRWDTIKDEVRLLRPLPLGTEVRGDFVTLPPELNTMLFTTREGGCGIIQVEPYNPKTASRVIRYRMWRVEGSVTSETSERSSGWGETVEVSLPVIATSTKSFWSIDKQQAVELTLKLTPEELRTQALSWAPDKKTPIDEWRLQNSVQFFPFMTTSMYNFGSTSDEPKPRLQLYLFDGKIREVRPQSFESMSVETAKTLLEEHSTIEFGRTLSFTRRDWPNPSYLFTTLGGHSGMLQITKSDEKAGVIEFQYKLFRK